MSKLHEIGNNGPRLCLTLDNTVKPCVAVTNKSRIGIESATNAQAVLCH